MNNQQQTRDNIIRLMRKRGFTLAQISKEVPCHRITLDKFMKNDDLITPIMFMMIQQWVGDNLKENKETNE